MKIVLLDTGRGVDSETIRMWRENLELAETDEVALLAWQPPREPLPVTEHYVFGPRLSLRGTRPRQVETLGSLFGGHDLDAAELAEDAARQDEDLISQVAEDEDPDSQEIGGDDSPVSESDLAGQMVESVADEGERNWDVTEFVATGTADPDLGDADVDDLDVAGQVADSVADEAAADEASAASFTVGDPASGTGDPALIADGLRFGADEVVFGVDDPAFADEAGNISFDAQPDEPDAPASFGPSNAAHKRVAGLPVYHPQRLRHAVTWRGRKAVRAGRASFRRAKRTARQKLKVSSSPVAKAAKRAIATRSGSIATQFGIALVRSPEAAQLFRGADLVFPVDARSQRGAWLLARANPGPDVMVGYPAAIRALSKRRRS